MSKPKETRTSTMRSCREGFCDRCPGRSEATGSDYVIVCDCPHHKAGSFRVLAPGESVPEGARRVHLYPFADVLRPRGSMEKESMSLRIYETLCAEYEHWTDEKYGDCPPDDEAAARIAANLLEEAGRAVEEFGDYVRARRVAKEMRRQEEGGEEVVH